MTFHILFLCKKNILKEPLLKQAKFRIIYLYSIRAGYCCANIFVIYKNKLNSKVVRYKRDYEILLKSLI